MSNRYLAISALVTVILGILGGIVLLLHDPVVAVTFAGAALLLTLFFGIPSWEEKAGRIAVIIAASAMGASMIIMAFLLFSWQQEKDKTKASIEKVLSEKDAHPAKEGADQERLRGIGEGLLKKKGDEEGDFQVEGLLSVQAKLEKELRELKDPVDEAGVIEVQSGDLAEPYGDGRANALLKIGSPDRFLQIRLRYDAEEDAYHVLGWKSGP